MTRVVIESGSCGFTTTVVAERGADGAVRLTVESGCEMVRKLGADLTELQRMAAFTRIPDNPVYRAAAKHLKHVACPVASGILKALEVESGFNAPKDAKITFLRE